VEPVLDATFPVTLLDPADCPRYVGRVIRGVDPAAETPLWMKERLRRAGIRSLGPLVDVTNYVMLELGQPMHAFDLDRLTGGIEVRRARPGDRLELLNGVVVEPDAETLLITDQAGPLALAGIMGGEISSCTDVTRDVFLESAFFAPASIAGRARRYGLQTDSSYRFERGVDSRLQRRAAERATRLLWTSPAASRDRSSKRCRPNSCRRSRLSGCDRSVSASCWGWTSPPPRSRKSCDGWVWRWRSNLTIGGWFRRAAASTSRWKWI
jgi:phenylalanyl-tRNA synthetase beta subunit